VVLPNFFRPFLHKVPNPFKKTRDSPLFAARTKKMGYHCNPTLLTLNLILWKTRCKSREFYDILQINRTITKNFNTFFRFIMLFC